MKGFLAICIFTLFSLCYFSAFPGSTWRHSIARMQKTSISHILFGISGSAKTWSRRRHYCELWWKPNVTRGFVWLERNRGRDASSGLKPPPYKVSAERLGLTVRIARIVKESFELGLENVRWFVMGDDDTVFFTENLVNVLNKYDYKQMYYIGGNSESVEQDMVHSYTMGYGGGGFAISYPLAAELVRILDGCIDRYAEFYGSDQKIGGCMSEIGVPVTKELGFHQLDIRGSPYGLLSAHPLAPLVSLHHLDYVQPLFPGMNRVASVKKLMNAYKSDPSRALQHTFCYDLTRDWSISVSWGYTVQLYPFFVTAKDLNTPLQTFLTWRTWSREPFTFNTRNLEIGALLRSAQWRQCDRKNYKAAYLVKGFNVSAGFLDPQFLNEAPRRECCEITSGSDQQDGVVQVRIRGCNQWESVTPP
ncbi:hypothetical protein Pfo_028908 [Paulownia fortunei]|nr:hypothetical protein Pfo_028908 [Paulownia fortunei]